MDRPFPSRWSPSDPDLIQLYSMNTPNGQKVSIALEEMGLGYEPHLIDILAGDQHDPEYLRLSPNGKIPTLIDPHGPEGEPVVLMESIVILVYLAEKSGSLLPPSYLARLEHLQWLLFQAAHVGPMFGQLGHFYKFARDKTSDDYALKRYTAEARRLLGVLDERLKGREYLVDDYSIVDIATAPWVEGLDSGYGAADHLGMAEFERVTQWLRRVTSRPAYQRGKAVNARV